MLSRILELENVADIKCVLIGRLLVLDDTGVSQLYGHDTNFTFLSSLIL